MKLLLLNIGFVVLFLDSGEAARTPRIYNGLEAQDGQFPYMSLLTYGGSGKDAWKMCGAAIIHPRWAITAAHCILPDQGPLLTVGTVGDFGSGKTYEVDQFYAHENYTYVPEFANNGLEIVYNDIGLLHLKTDIEFNDKVKNVKLETDENKNYEDVEATITGWGREFYDGESSDHLVVAMVPTLTLDECRKVWTYADKHICTSNKDRGVCNGDSGSPLVVDGVQIGIASTTDTFCESLKPDVYTKVASFIPWVEKTLSKHGDTLE